MTPPPPPAACPDLIQKQTTYASSSSHLFIPVMLLFFSSASIGLHALCLAFITTIFFPSQKKKNVDDDLQQTATNVGYRYS